MSKEFGIDPQAINTFDKFFRVIPNFGPKHFRFIRRYPSKWSSKVKKAINNVPPKAKARIIEKLIQIDKQLVDCISTHNGNPIYDGNISWYDNSINYHTINPFDGIIANCTSNYSFVCNISSFDIDSNPIFDVTSSYKVRRTPVDMANSAKQLLQQAREIHFVDPHLEKTNQRHIRPLIKFIEVICNRINKIPINKVVYHIGNEISDTKVIINAIDNYILPKLPQGFTLNFVRWPSEKIHNRFILTDIGGMSFGIGLDDDDFNPNRNQYDDVAPLAIEVCKNIGCGNLRFMDDNLSIFHIIRGS